MNGEFEARSKRAEMVSVLLRQFDAEANAARLLAHIAVRGDEAEPVRPWLVADVLEVRRTFTPPTRATTDDLVGGNGKPGAFQGPDDSTGAHIEASGDRAKCRAPLSSRDHRGLPTSEDACDGARLRVSSDVAGTQ
jgi:hypothetical protein